MYVKIELYKTNFDEENVFVGTTSQTVDNVLDGFTADEKLVIPLSPFNLKYPFRLAIPYFNVARKYNYARYRFYNTQDETATPADTRYYFVEDFIPIDDQSTELRVREDILARVFYDLQYQSFLPDRLTYKKGIYSKVFNVEEYQSSRYRCISSFAHTGGLFNMTACKDTGFANSDIILGAIIITAVTNNPTTNYTIEGGVKYPVLTLMLPFAFAISASKDYDTNFELVANRKFFVGVVQVGSIDEYISLAQYTTDGFKIISTDINFNLGGYFRTVFATDKYSIFDDASGISSDVIELGRKKYMRILQNNTQGTVPLQILPPGENAISVKGILTEYGKKELFANNGQLLQMPFIKFELRTNGKVKVINPLYISDDFEFYYTQSFLPPYSKGIVYSPNIYDNTVGFDASTQFGFFSYDDTYAEFLRANYNSQITGLKVSQESERGAAVVRGVANILKAGVSGVTGVSAGAQYSATGVAVGAIRGIGGVINAGIETAASAGELAINQAKEQKLLDLKLADIQNLPDTVNISNALAIIWSERLFMVFGIFQNETIDTFIEDIKRYGVSAPVRSTTMKNHAVFDYVRCTDITFTQKSITLSEVERSAVEKYFRDGVRLWYDYSHYKDFNADNPEV